MRTALSLIVRATRCNRRYSKSRLREAGYGWVVEADITAYFDNVDHSLLFARVAELAPDEKVTELIRLWMAARVYDGRQLTKLTKGCLRDHRFHPLLANLYLDTFDERMLSAGQQLVRFADDFLILCKTSHEPINISSSNLRHSQFADLICSFW